MDINHWFRKTVLAALLAVSIPVHADTVICFIVFGPCTNETKERTKEKGDRDSELTTVGSELGAQVKAEGARTMVDGAEVSTSVSPGGDNQTHTEPDK